MGGVEIDGVQLTPLDIIDVENGNVMHAMKINDVGYKGFGEAYFSCIKHGAVKAWKRHRQMTLNLVVPVGKIRFVIYDDRDNSKSKNKFSEVILSRDNYCRLTIPPMVWVGFQGLASEANILLNIASIQHDPCESDKKEIDEINTDWNIN